MTPAGSTATIDAKVGSGVGTPSQIDQRLATIVLESRNMGPIAGGKEQVCIDIETSRQGQAIIRCNPILVGLER